MDDPCRPSPLPAVNAPPPAVAHAPEPLVCFNFKVPLRVRQQFKIYAARHDLTMTELLLELIRERLHAK